MKIDQAMTRKYLEFATRVAKEAGDLTLEHFQSNVQVKWKVDGTPVTVADEMAEKLICERIQTSFREHGVLGEESGKTLSREGEARWIIDPIDGTRAFMRGVPLYAVLIALEIGGQIQVGVAHFPALSETITAGRGLGCTWNSRTVQLSPVQKLEDTLLVHTNFKSSRLREKQTAWQRLQKAVQHSAGWGDAYGYLLVATGRAEIMLDPRLNPWDGAPFAVIFSELDGYFGDWKGNATIYAGEGMATSNTLLPQVLAHLKT